MACGPVISYALALNGNDTERLFQLISSLFSLRRHNVRIPVYLHVTGDFEPVMGFFLGQQLGVTCVRYCGFTQLLEAALPGSGERLADHEVMIKFLVMSHLRDLQPEQVLYVDNDTYFFSDPALLMQRCTDADIYAREEPNTPLSPSGYKPDYLDDARYRALLGDAPYVPPFNTGVMIMNHGVWNRFLDRLPTYLRHLVHFTGENGVPSADYPAASPWIRDQVAFWVTMASVPGFRVQVLQQADLLMGCEEINAWKALPAPVISHYFTSNSLAFFEHLPDWPYQS